MKSESWAVAHNITSDGQHYEVTSERVLFTSYYFLSDIRHEHIRRVYNILDILSELGGIKAALFAIFGALSKSINIQLFMMEMISEL